MLLTCRHAFLDLIELSDFIQIIFWFWPELVGLFVALVQVAPCLKDCKSIFGIS